MTATNSPKLPLFVPGHRADIAPKAAASGADMVIIDLEDAVAEPDKEAARAQLANSAPLSVPIAARINSSDSPWFATDLDAVKASPAEMVILPKAESAIDLDSVRDALGSDMPILPIIETACGLDTVATLLAHPMVPLCAFGHLDFSLVMSDMPGLSSDETEVTPRLRLAVDSESPEIVSVKLDNVLSGGDTTIDKTLSEDELYKLELDSFMKLIETKKTQDRINHTLATGKPLVN